jgi:hypothetical protein
MRGDDLKVLTLYVKFRLGDVVYLKIRQDSHKGMVTGITHRPTGTAYSITWEDGCESGHYDIELTDTYIPEYDLSNGDDD